ncbi:MAG TPA: arsenosugar biosynthesis radical SAM protein ArsS, partial [Burkholderiales bacterium]|nr:arsenosugar biosynthesis radical SAM protein ArsS [Burkholderiales bacterium]
MSSPRATTSLRSRAAPLAATAMQLKVLSRLPQENFSQKAGRLSPTGIGIFQINVGKLCNMTCRHCHVDAGPDR